MLRYAQGNLLTASVEALVNTVNEKGVMGKGIALMFKEAFPDSAREYENAARRGEIHVGKVFVTRETGDRDPRWIIHFPTKKHWRNRSKLEWVREGLQDLVRVIGELRIHSVALPPLGAGNGKLEWRLVRGEIDAAFGAMVEVDVLVFEPTSAYLNAPKRSGVEALTPARALVVELVRRYSILGPECTNLEIQKLVWFLQQAIFAMGLEDPLRLAFKADKYGPYADGLRHLLNALDGSYLHAAKRLADAGPLEPIAFSDDKREEVASYLRSERAAKYVPALEQATAVIDGFESPHGMELLATVDWILRERHVAPTVAAIKTELQRWPGDSEAGARKLRILNERLLQLALSRLVTKQPVEDQPGS